jgi:hypothetical protein
MIQVSSNTTNALNKAVNVSVTNGCHVEYNMNDLISGVSVTAPEGVITATLTAPASQGGYQYKPFEKLFPIKSIIDPRRPKVAGIQYMIVSDPSLSATLSSSGSGSAKTYASAKELSRRLYFSGIKTAYKYWVTPKAAGTILSNCVLTVSYPANKTAATNKIVVKFETSHSKPTSWTLRMSNLSGLESLIYTGTTCPDNGIVNLYYNGSSWSETEPSVVSEGVSLSGLKLQINTISVSFLLLDSRTQKQNQSFSIFLKEDKSRRGSIYTGFLTIEDALEFAKEIKESKLKRLKSEIDELESNFDKLLTFFKK